MSVSRERLIKQLSSSIFSPNMPSEDVTFKPKKRFSRDNSSENLAHGILRYSTPTRNSLRPLDHSPIDMFGDSPTGFYKKNDQGFYKSFFQPTKPQVEKRIKKMPPSANSAKILKKPEPENLLKKVEPEKAFFKPEPRKIISEKPRPSKSPLVLPRPEEARVELLQIRGLRSNDDEMSIKSMCQGTHVIEIVPDINNVTGNCLGTAQIKVRNYLNSPSFEKLKLNLMQKGLDVEEVNVSTGKKNNYLSAGKGFLDSQLQQEEKRCAGNNLSSMERKRAILATSDDLFGSAPGCGKVDSFLQSRNDCKQLQETRENLRKWENTRNANSKSPISIKRVSTSGYLKPTLSSIKKNSSYRE